jgi:hypothetical protein
LPLTHAFDEVILERDACATCVALTLLYASDTLYGLRRAFFLG